MSGHRIRLVATGVLLVAAVLAGCGDGPDRGSGAASVDEFCSALGKFEASVDAADSDDLAAYIRALKAAAASLAEVGVPDEMPADARAGFELTVERIEELANDASRDDLARLGDVGEEDQRRLDALTDYVEDACPDLSP